MNSFLFFYRISKVILAIALITALLLSIAIAIVLSLIPVYLPTRSISPVNSAKSARIAIIGAGLSGLTAGVTLLDSNIFSTDKIFIYEANSNIGGRIQTKFWSPDNQSSEWGGEYLDSNYYVTFNLTNRFGIRLLDTIEAANTAYGSIYYFLKRYYNQTQAWIDYKVIEGTIKQQIEQIGTINYNESNSYGRYFDNLSLYDWIEQYVPNGHRSDLGEYIDSAYQQEFGLDTTDLSSISFLFLIAPNSQPANGPLSIYGLSDQRYRMVGGNSQLPRKMSEYLTQKGVSIQLNHNLTKIAKLKNNKYRLTFENNQAYTFDHVLLTLPLTTLRYVDYSQAQFDSLKQRVINEMSYGTNTKINIQFSKRFWYDLSADGLIYTDLPFLNSWEESLGQQGDTGILVMLTGKSLFNLMCIYIYFFIWIIFLGGTEGKAFNPRTVFDDISNVSNDVSASAYVNGFLSNLNEIWPNASKYYTGKSTVSAPWFSKYYLGSYPAYGRNQYSRISGYESARQGNVHFSGDYASVESLGLMEGATAEGQRAAYEIINDYK